MSNPFVVYHTDTAPQAFGDYPIEREIIEAAGGELRLLDAGKSADELAGLLADADAAMVGKAPITAAVLDAMPRCQVVVRYGVGVETLDLAAATERGVVCAHVPDFCAEEVSNHALLLLLMVAKRAVELDGWVRSGRWRAGPLAPMPALHGQTLGLVGCGNIARALARKAAALRMRVTGYDPHLPAETLRAAGIEPRATLAALLADADAVSVHTPLSDETRRLIDAAALAAMKPGAILINTARGAVVDEAALVDALAAGHLGGAGLDVFEREPLPADSPLTGFDKVVLMPHSASYSDDAFRLLSRRVADSVVAVMNGVRPRFVANPAVLERLALRDAQAVEKWRVLRQDDNGNKFVVAENLDRESAQRRAAELTATGHRQRYWSEQQRR